MLKIIKNLLLLIIDNINAGNSVISEKEQIEVINLLQKLNLKEYSKIEAAQYIDVSRATFDNYISKGLIPQGIKKQGFKELIWYKKDLDKFLKSSKK